MQIEAQLGELRIVQPIDAESRRRTGKLFGVGALRDPARAQRRKAGTNVDLHRRIGVRARRVVNGRSADSSRRRTTPSVSLCAISRIGHAQVGARAFYINLAGFRQRLDRCLINLRRCGQELRIGAHRFPPAVLTASGSGDSLNRIN